jgi:hypothetical protein
MFLILRFASRWRFLIEVLGNRFSLANGFNSFLIYDIKRLTRVLEKVWKRFGKGFLSSVSHEIQMDWILLDKL